jgi:hypothetical protein
VTFVRDGSTVNPLAVAGTLDVVVTAHDEPAMSAPPPWNALPVAPVLIRWRVLAGANVVQPWRTAVDFRGALPPPWDYSDVYAPGTRQNFPNWPGRYRFFLERDWYANQLPDGDYVLEVAAWDTAGNTATEDVPFAVIGWMRVPRRR